MGKSISFFLFFLIMNSVIAQDFNYDKEFQKGDSLVRNGSSSEAVSTHYKLIEYVNANFKGEKRKEELFKNHLNLANAYCFKFDSLAISHANQAIKYSKLLKDVNSIGEAYNQMYYCLYYGNNGQELNRIADSCLRYSSILRDNKKLGEAYMHKFNALIELGRVDEGKAYCLKAEKIFDTISNKLYLSAVYGNIANVYLKIDDAEKSKEYHLKALQLSEELQNLGYKVDDYRNLAEDYYLLGQYKQASEYYKLYVDSSDLYNSITMDQKFSEADAKYNGLQKDKEIVEQQVIIEKEKINKMYLIFGMLLLFIGMIIYYFYRTNNQKKQKQLIDLELRKEKEMNSLRTIFLENIAHEIRTPITLINGYLSLAKDKIDDKIEIEKNIQAALNSSENVLSNANEILELLKNDRGKLPIRKVNIELESFLKRVFFSFDSLAKIKNIELVYSSNIEGDIVINSDESRIEKILNNFISNAVKFAPSKSKIEFIAKITEEKLEIKVIDKGPGIEKSEQDKIFKRFYQIENAENIGGVGVGLSLAKDFAESIGGSVSVYSEKGIGATFTFVLPCETFTMNSTFPEEKPDQKSQISAIQIEQNAKILIVEDNVEMNAFLSKILSIEYTCETAFDGIEALEKVQQKKYDLIISDVMMPNMNGLDLKKKINLLANYKTVPFVLLTAKTLEENRIEAYKLGIDDYISKPFIKEELLVRIKILLKNKKERESWIKDNIESVDSDNLTSEEKLLEQVKSIVFDNIQNEKFRVTDLAESVGYSQRQLSRLLKKSTGMSPVQFILDIRLQKAYIMLLDKKYSTLSELRFSVGIPSAVHFNKKFTERFGVKPAELRKMKNID